MKTSFLVCLLLWDSLWSRVEAPWLLEWKLPNFKGWVGGWPRLGRGLGLTNLFHKLEWKFHDQFYKVASKNWELFPKGKSLFSTHSIKCWFCKARSFLCFGLSLEIKILASRLRFVQCFSWLNVIRSVPLGLAVKTLLLTPSRLEGPQKWLRLSNADWLWSAVYCVVEAVVCSPACSVLKSERWQGAAEPVVTMMHTMHRWSVSFQGDANIGRSKPAVARRGSLLRGAHSTAARRTVYRPARLLESALNSRV